MKVSGNKYVLLVLVGLLLTLVLTSGIHAADKITVWTWHEPWANSWRQTLTRYAQTHDLEFEVVQMPWTEYWQKLATAIPANQGPDLYNLHSSYLTAHIKGGFAAPWPTDVFSRENLIAAYPVIDSFLVNDTLYTMPLGMGTIQVYYNKTLWKEAGLELPDVNNHPRTWDEMLEIAQKLTKYNSRGEVIQSGFNQNGSIFWLWYTMLYQKGRWFFTEDGRGVQANSPESHQALQFIHDMYYKHKVCSPDFLPATEALGSGLSGAQVMFPHLSDTLDINYPDLDYGVFPVPTFTGEPIPAWGLLAPEPWPVVNNRIDDSKKAIAFDILKTLIFDDDEDLVDWNYHAGYIPLKESLWNHEKIVERPHNVVSAKMAPFSILITEQPSPIWAETNTEFMEDAFLAGLPVDQILEGYTQDANWKLSEQEYIFLAHERQYEYAKHFIED